MNLFRVDEWILLQVCESKIVSFVRVRELNKAFHHFKSIMKAIKFAKARLFRSFAWESSVIESSSSFKVDDESDQVCESKVVSFFRVRESVNKALHDFKSMMKAIKFAKARLFRSFAWESWIKVFMILSRSWKRSSLRKQDYFVLLHERFSEESSSSFQVDHENHESDQVCESKIVSFFRERELNKAFHRF